jgi:hypothetical protein
VVAVDDAQPSLFLIDTADGRITREVRLEGVPKAAQIARYAPDNSLLCVTSLNSDTVSLIDPSVRQQTAIKVGSQPMDMAFRGDELFVACQGPCTSSIFQSDSQSIASVLVWAANRLAFSNGLVDQRPPLARISSEGPMKLPRRKRSRCWRRPGCGSAEHIAWHIGGTCRIQGLFPTMG